MAEDNKNELPSVAEYSAPIDEQDRPEPLPEGEYVAEVTMAKRQLSKSSNKPTIELTLKVSKERYPHDYKGPEGGVSLRHWSNGDDTDQGRYNIKNLCVALGAPVPKRSFDVQSFLGRTATIRVTHEEFPAGSGTKNARVKDIKKVA